LSPYATAEQYYESSDAHTMLNKLLYVDTKTYLHELLMKQDQMSMAASIESRVPFLDHKLVEFAARMPESMKVRGMTTKYVLPSHHDRRVAAGDPESAGRWAFPVPIGVVAAWPVSARARRVRAWPSRTCARPVRVRRRSSVSSRATSRARRIIPERLWSLINLEMWQRMQFDGEPWEDLRASVSRSASLTFAMSA
jgi:asparagine synthase (glutamine-hydrolysing)